MHRHFHARPRYAAVAALCLLAVALPAAAQPHRDDHRDRGYRGGHWDDHRGWHRPYGYGGGYYPPPPVVYSPPYYAPPPVVYSPGIGVNIHIP